MKPTQARIEDCMTHYPSITSRNTSVTEAVEYMKSHRIRHLPVVEKGEVIGVVSDRDLKQAELLSDSMTLVVSDFMTPEPYCVVAGTPLSVVAQEMAEKKYGCAVVLNSLGQVIGIFTTTDGVRVLAKVLESGQSSEVKSWGIEKLLAGKLI